MSTAEQNRLADKEFAFPKQRKEPLTDARHVRNAIARFDQAEGVSDADRDRRGSGFSPPRNAMGSRLPPAGGTWLRAAKTTSVNPDPHRPGSAASPCTVRAERRRGPFSRSQSRDPRSCTWQ